MQLLSLVKDFDIITIFRHQVADHDALGAQFAMKEYLKTAFPEKEVYALGKSVGPGARLYPSIDEVDDEKVYNSVAIVLDSANKDRVDDARFQKAKCILKIDHHIVVDEYVDADGISARIRSFAVYDYLKSILESEGCDGQENSRPPPSVQLSSVQSLSRVRLFATP